MILGITGAVTTPSTPQVRQALFRKFDTNGDGVIDKPEMQAALEAGKKYAAYRQKGNLSAEQVFEKFDTNKDGVISQGEFDVGLSKAQSSTGTSINATSSVVDFLTAVNGSGGTAASTTNQAGTITSLLKNHLAECGRLAKLQTSQSFTKVV
ncbi:MAG: EF-hand domain-containing protein [Syntrophorhabdales bacterium]|jgi:hypothetical protein